MKAVPSIMRRHFHQLREGSSINYYEGSSIHNDLCEAEERQRHGDIGRMGPEAAGCVVQTACFETGVGGFSLQGMFLSLENLHALD